MNLSTNNPDPMSLKPMKPTEGLPFDKYWYYIRSVQSPDVDVEFFDRVYKELRGESAKTLREDFCGTFAISCEWVKLGEDKRSVGVDLDPEPIAYGEQYYRAQLNEEQKSRVQIIEDNVLTGTLPTTDIVVACNFSYSIFKKRQVLKNYFSNVYNQLGDDGVFILDIFGGSQCYEPNEEETEHEGFSYFWDQDSFDPVTNDAMFFIHFQPDGEPKTKAFTYDWRLWSIPELRDILEEVGFSKVNVYWEGTDEDGEGDGDFQRVEEGEDCESWIAYLACEKNITAN